MKKHRINILFALLLSLPYMAMADGLVHGTVTIDDKTETAEYIIIGSEAYLGSGYNACISEYSEGNVVVPATITYNNQEYPVTKVSNVAFRYCTKITEVHLPANVTRVGDFAFQGCRALLKVELPSALTSIGTGAFIDLPYLYKIDCHATTPPVWEYNDVFKFHTGGIGDSQTYSYGIMLCVPESSQEAYSTALYSNSNLGWNTPDGWGHFENIYNTYDENAEAYTVYNASDHSLTFYYDGMRSERTGTTYDLNIWNDVTESTPAWITEHANDIQSVEFAPSFQFARPETTVQWFCGCTNLDTIVGWEYLDTEEVLGMGSMFRGCQNLTSEDIELTHFNTAKVKSMGRMFEDCQGLTTLDFYFFYTQNCENMRKMFSNCSNLTSVNLNTFTTDNVVLFDSMFYNCSKLETLDISFFKINEEAQTTIDGYNGLTHMMMNCSSLTSLIIPSSIRTMESFMFYGCTSMEDVYYYGPGPFAYWFGGFVDFAPNKATRFHVLASAYQDWFDKFRLANVTFVGDLCTNGDPLPLFGSADWEYVNELTQAGQSVNAIMMKDFIVNTMVGTWDHPFTGTFDGNGHTLIVNYAFTTGDGGVYNEAFIGPFRTIRNAEIKNLIVGGSISTTMNRSAVGGLVGLCHDNGNENVQNTITNCHVSVLITGSFTRMSGFIGASVSSGTDRVTNTVNGCLFDGRFEYIDSGVGYPTTYAGVITCFGTPSNQIVNHCFENGSYGGRINNYTFCGMFDNTLGMVHSSTNNCYCITESMAGNAKRAYSITVENNDKLNFVLYGSGNSTPEPIAEYDVSGIKAHSPGLELPGVRYVEDINDIEVFYTYYASSSETVCGTISTEGLAYDITGVTATNGATTHFYNTAFDYFTVQLATDNTIVTVTAELSSISLDAVNLDNQMVLHDQEGVSTLVGINNLTLSKDVAWNTLCLPFDVPNLSGTYLEGATLRVLDTITFENRVIVYHFKDTTAINADKPYLVKVSENVNNPYFYPVTIKRSLPPGMKIRFDENQYKGFSILGNYNYMTADDLNKDINEYTALYLDGTSLRVVDSTTTLPGFNVFFEILEMPLSDAEAVVLDIEGYNNIFIDLDDLTSDNLFYKDGDWNDPENWAIETLPNGSQKVHIEGQAVIPNNYTAEANEIVIDNGSITIADGGQLIHNNEGVVATVKKNIAAYSGDGGYYLLTNPMADVQDPETLEMTSGNYDLYWFDQSQELEWKNYKQVPFNLTNGTGYLYANDTVKELAFNGVLNRANADISVPVTYDANADFAGWNLVGNPFVCDAYLADGRDFYVLNEAGDEVTTANGAIAPMQGVFVQTTETEAAVSFTTTAPTQGRALNLNITRDRNAFIDNARIRFGEGRSLEKFQLNQNHSKLYIPQEGRDYAVVCSEAQGELPVDFKAEENGTYTLNIGSKDVEFSYLHLIDNMTGNDIDLLVNPSYTFEANTTDYASRFKLVFCAKETDVPSTGSGTFAFISNGNIIVNGEGVLQIVDVMGHIVVSTDVARNVCTAGMTPGVYVLRLINGYDVKTQKIIIQ
jgi:hypothetical protein